MPANKLGEALEDEILRLTKEMYVGYNDSHFTEELAERHQIKVSCSTVRRRHSRHTLPLFPSTCRLARRSSHLTTIPGVDKVALLTSAGTSSSNSRGSHGDVFAEQFEVTLLLNNSL